MPEQPMPPLYPNTEPLKPQRLPAVEDMFDTAVTVRTDSTPPPLPVRPQTTPNPAPLPVSPVPPGAAERVPPVPPVGRPNRAPESEAPKRHHWKFVILCILIAVLLGGAGLAVLQFWYQSPRTTAATDDIANFRPVETPPLVDASTNANTDSGSPANQPVEPPLVDSDGDGLLDTEEKELGTSPSKLDSDADGLTDRQEVRIYKTDPLKVDSDGDSYVDGQEVRHFYNPNGPGKIRDAVDAIQDYESQQ